jgi:hypothetical protein
MAEQIKITEKSKYRIEAPPTESRFGFFQRLHEAAQKTGAWFPKPYSGAEDAQQMVSFPLNDIKLKDLVAALNAQRDEFQHQADQAIADRDEILRQASEQGYVS